MAFFPIFLVLLLLPLILFVYNRKKKNLNLPPGPPKLPIIGNFHQLGKLPHQSLHKLAKKYGPIMYLQLGRVPTVVISSPEYAKLILKTYDLECCSRPICEGARRLTYNFTDMAFTPYSDYWREMRRICALELLSSKRVRSPAFASVRDKAVASLIESISQSIPNPVNLSEKIFFLLDKIICELAIGKYYEGKQFKNTELEKAIHEGINMLGSFSASQFVPYVGPIIDFLTGVYAKREKNFHLYDEFLQKVIDEHLDPDRPIPEREDLVDALIKVMNDQTGLTQDHIKGILMNIFLGGIDTSVLTVVWGMSELMRCPRAMKKVQAEIRSYVGKTDKPLIEDTICENIKYLKMVIKETLRLHPPVVFLIPHKTVDHVKLGGYDIYPDTTILVNTRAVGRDSEVWKNPDEFHPERFEDETIDYKGQNFELIPFGSGRRICPGLFMGSTHVTFALGNLLYYFDWKMPDGMTRGDISMEEEYGLTTHKKTPLCLVPVKYNWQE